MLVVFLFEHFNEIDVTICFTTPRLMDRDAKVFELVKVGVPGMIVKYMKGFRV